MKDPGWSIAEDVFTCPLLAGQGLHRRSFVQGHEVSDGAGTHSIEGKKWLEKAGHFARDFLKGLAPNGTRIAWYIVEIGPKIFSEIPGDGCLEGP